MKNFVDKDDQSGFYNNHVNSQDASKSINDRKTSPINTINSLNDSQTTKLLEFTFKKDYSSPKKCFARKSKDKSMMVISKPTIFDILSKSKILMDKNSRVCPAHLDEKGFLLDNCLNDIVPINCIFFIHETEVQELIQILFYLDEGERYYVCQIRPSVRPSLNSSKSKVHIYIYCYLV
jgi:hypothetical protein